MNHRPIIHIDDDDTIVCRHTLSLSEPDGYPVICFEPPGMRRLDQSVTLTMSRVSLRLLRDAIAAYEAAHGGDGIRVDADALLRSIAEGFDFEGGRG